MSILKLIKDLCCCCISPSSAEDTDGLLRDDAKRKKGDQTLSFGGMEGGTSEHPSADIYSPSSYTIVINGSPQKRKKEAIDLRSSAMDVTTPLLAELHSSQSGKSKTQTGFSTPPPRQGIKIPKTPQSGGSDLSFAGTPSP